MTRDRLAGDPRILLLVKWSAMVWAIVWTLIFRLGSEGSAIPEFVYVNF